MYKIAMRIMNQENADLLNVDKISNQFDNNCASIDPRLKNSFINTGYPMESMQQYTITSVYSFQCGDIA